MALRLGSTMTNLLQDLRFAARSFLRAPRFTVPAVLALALGIGATTAIFSVVRGVMLRPLPYSEPDRIVTIWESHAGRNRTRNVVGAANFIAWRERSQSLEHVGLVGQSRLNLMLNGQPEEVTGVVASSDVFAALGVQPAIGRVYNATEDLEGQDAVILISFEFWQSRLGGRDNVLGTTIVANGRPRTIVGVMPPGFTVEGTKASFMVPYGWTVERLRAAQGRGSSHGIARLRNGVSFEQAADEMRRIAAQLEQEAPQRNTGWSVTLVPIHELMIEQIRPALLVLTGAVAMVLLVACVNVANLLLARSTIRQRELGMRAALGAGRSRLIAQMLTESLLLATISGIAGLALAGAFHRGLLALVADRIPVPRLDQVALDSTVLAFTMMLALGTGVFFGLVPALLASSTAGETMRDGGRHGGGPRSRRALSTLVVAEVALSLVLLAGAGLLIRSFMRLQNIDPGFRADGLLTARVSLPSANYPDARRISGFFENAVSRISAVPGVESAGGVSFLPMAGPGIGTSFYRLDRPTPGPGEAPVTEVRPVSPGFFRAMGIPQVAGRDFTQGDTLDAPPVAIVSDLLVRSQYGSENPLGRRLHVNIGQPGGMEVEIVGVVGDIKMATLDADTRPAVYIPHPQLAVGLMTFVVRATPPMDPTSLAGGVTAAVRAIDPELPVADIKPMQEVVDVTLARPRTVSVLITAFALIALLLAGVGVYGVMAYSVSQRTQEIGVRMALGATTQSVFRLVLRQALLLVGIGVGTGLLAAALLAQALDALLYETAPLDPLTFAVTALVLTLVAVLASYVPARRGMRIAPVDALRTE
jgi:putative ABC transport system permease protein